MNQIRVLQTSQLAVFLLSSVLFGYACNDEKAERKAEHSRQESVEPITNDGANFSGKKYEGEIQPEPPGGISGFYEYVDANLKYPKAAKEDSVEGKVFVRFVITKEGKITEVEAIKSIGYGCDEEAMRIVRKSSPWKPATQNGTLVKVTMVLPISFRLDNLDTLN